MIKNLDTIKNENAIDNTPNTHSLMNVTNEQ